MKFLFSRRVAFAFILIFILSSAIFLYLFALKIDKKYSDLIVIETENSENIHKVTHTFDDAAFLLFNALVSKNADSISAYKQKWESYILINDSIFSKLSNTIFTQEHNSVDFINVTNAEKKYITNCELFFELVHNGNSDSSLSFLKNTIVPSYNIYQDNVSSLLKLNDNHLIEISDKLTVENKSAGLFYLSVGISPIAFLIIYLLIGVSLLSYLIFIFRHEDV